MDKELEKRLKQKIMAGEELTEEEKSYFVNYDEWKALHDSSRAGLIESYRWNIWPFLFICAFFLLMTAFNNTKILRGGGTLDGSTMLVTIASWILGIAGVIGSFLMKGRANKLAQERREAEKLILNPEKAAQTEAPSAETPAETAAETTEETASETPAESDTDPTDAADESDEDNDAENLEAMIKICRLFHKN